MSDTKSGSAAATAVSRDATSSCEGGTVVGRARAIARLAAQPTSDFARSCLSSAQSASAATPPLLRCSRKATNAATAGEIMRESHASSSSRSTSATADRNWFAPGDRTAAPAAIARVAAVFAEEASNRAADTTIASGRPDGETSQVSPAAEAAAITFRAAIEATFPETAAIWSAVVSARKYRREKIRPDSWIPSPLQRSPVLALLTSSQTNSPRLEWMARRATLPSLRCHPHLGAGRALVPRNAGERPVARRSRHVHQGRLQPRSQRLALRRSRLLASTRVAQATRSTASWTRSSARRSCGRRTQPGGQRSSPRAPSSS